MSAPQDPRPDLWLLPGPFRKLTGLGPTGTVGRRAPSSAAPGREGRGRSYRGSRAPPPATHLLFSQAWPRDIKPPPKRGGLPCLLRPQGPSNPQSVYTWGRESVGGSPNCEAHVLPARARLRVMEEQDQTVETESTDRPQAARAMPGQPADPPTQTLGPRLWLCEKGAFFRGDISS